MGGNNYFHRVLKCSLNHEINMEQKTCQKNLNCWVSINDKTTKLYEIKASIFSIVMERLAL